MALTPAAGATGHRTNGYYKVYRSSSGELVREGQVFWARYKSRGVAGFAICYILRKRLVAFLRKSDAAPGRSLVTSAPGDRLIRSLPGVFVDARPPGPVASVRDGREVPAPRDRASPHGMHTLHTPAFTF